MENRTQVQRTQIESANQYTTNDRYFKKKFSHILNDYFSSVIFFLFFYQIKCEFNFKKNIIQKWSKKKCKK